MKIREVRIRNFRNFGANAGAVSFVDPLTHQVRPLSVLVGSNGCGKTTVLDTIAGLLASLDPNMLTADFAQEIARKGYAHISVDFTQGEPSESIRGIPTPSWFVAGGAAHGPVDEPKVDPSAVLKRRPNDGRSRTWSPNWHEKLSQWVLAMTTHQEPLRGGLIYFPHRRWVEYEEKGSITEPSQARDWLFRFAPESGWTGSLSQLWVWQNYLDLEQGREGRPNLTPFVEAIEAILGRDRRVTIRSGRVYVEQPGREAVQPHQLPSGEQQILTLFGEIIRHMRPGGVLIIDEVEISLHPALQRVVLHHLRELAARYDLQIILTTHSMEIVAAVAPDELVNLDDMVLQERAQSGGAA
jgi:energy-coupling factor transporter ATP-binding protein EcfA2